MEQPADGGNEEEGSKPKAARRGSQASKDRLPQSMAMAEMKN